MSNNSKDKKELEIDEDKAYLELCQIIAEAIQTQDIELLQARITEWKRKYPYQKFSKNLKAKIDYLLNQYYSEVINQILASIKKNEEKKEFDQRKAILKLYRIIKSTNDIKDLNKKVEKWKKEFKVDDFMDMYKKKVKKLSSKKNLEDNAFDTDKAYYELYYLLKTNATYDELKDRVSIWEKNYSIGDKFSTDNFKKHTSDVKQYLNDEYLYSISKEEEKEDSLANKESSVAIQTESYNKFMKILKAGNMAKAVEWIYKNRNISFGKFYKEQIISQTAFKFPLSDLGTSKLNLNLNERGLSFEEYKNIDESRRYIITLFIESLMKETNVNGSTFKNIFDKSEFAKSYKVNVRDEDKIEVKEPKIGNIKSEEEKDLDKVINKELPKNDFISKEQYANEEIELKEINKEEVELVQNDEKVEEGKQIEILKKDEQSKEVKTLKEEIIEELKSTEKDEEVKEVILPRENEDSEEKVSLVLNLNSEIQKDNREYVTKEENTSKVIITELEPERIEISKPELKQEKVVEDEKESKTDESYIIVSPDLLKVIYEKSLMAETMTKKGNGKDDEEDFSTITIKEIDEHVSEQVNLEREPEEEFLIHTL